MKDDFVYCDPPCNDCFTDYQAGGSGTSDQKHLRKIIAIWVEGCDGNGQQCRYAPDQAYLSRGQDRYIFEVEAPRHVSAKQAGFTVKGVFRLWDRQVYNSLILLSLQTRLLSCRKNQNYRRSRTLPQICPAAIVAYRLAVV